MKNTLEISGKVLGVILPLVFAAPLPAASPLEDPRRPVATTTALTPQQTARSLKVPEGFRVELIAGEPDIVQPIAYTIDDRGRLWVVENTNYPNCPGEHKDRLLVLEDTHGNGVFDKRTVFTDQLPFTSGIAVGFNGVWLGAPPNLLYIPIAEGDAPKPAGPAQALLDGWASSDTHETLNSFVWGPDGWLYGTQGIFNSSLVGRPGTEPEKRIKVEAAIWRYHPQRHVFERWCEGGSNQWGVDWNDEGEAFFEACVIPHMWHAIQGARYQRQAGVHPDTHTYEDIKTIAWGRYEKAAYCGAMVYLGDAFPREWRNSFFFHDIHMNKLRSERMIPVGSGYRSERHADFLKSDDPWFRGLSPQYGPDGGVFVNDWYDRVPCHQQAAFSDRSNGRIYKIVTDAVRPAKTNLSAASDAALVELHLHQNEWFVRHARRILQERGASNETRSALENILLNHPDQLRRLRALWTLHSMGALSERCALAALSSKDAHLRGWAITCVTEGGTPSPAVRRVLDSMAVGETSPVARLRLSSAAQRLPAGERWDWIAPLSMQGEDTNDQNLPLLNWYAIEPAVPLSPAKAVALATKTRQPQLAKFISRRLAAEAAANPEASEPLLAPLVEALGPVDSNLRTLVLQGISAGLKGQTNQRSPKNWEATYNRLETDPSEEVRRLASQVGLNFGSEGALRALRTALSNEGQTTQEREAALEGLSSRKDGPSLDLILKLSQSPSPLRLSAIKGLAFYDDPRIHASLVANFSQCSPVEQKATVLTLATRIEGTQRLLSAVDSREIPISAISAPIATVIQGFNQPAFAEWLEKNWGTLRSSSAQKASEIERYKKFLGAEAMKNADLKRGRELFRSVCAGCHEMFGSGGQIGPHLPGGFSDLDYLLQNILDPNAAIGKDYQLLLVTLDDGSLKAGIIAAEDASTLTLKIPGFPAPVAIAKNRIQKRELSQNSLMPEGLLNGLQEPDIRSLFLYLRQTEDSP